MTRFLLKCRRMTLPKAGLSGVISRGGCALHNEVTHMKHVSIDVIKDLKELLEHDEPVSIMLIDENNNDVGVLLNMVAWHELNDNVSLQSILAAPESVS